ncbi:MAG TPA: OmpA family protein, partial [Usitatibacteraceae bacterium]|nr:OmpA family protein [Usitatibacteraceae bacterium]
AAPGAPAAPAKPATPSAPAKPAPASVKQAIVIQADALFDFDKSVVRPDGKKRIDDALAKLKGVDVEMVIATGHTDSV